MGEKTGSRDKNQEKNQGMKTKNINVKIAVTFFNISRSLQRVMMGKCSKGNKVMYKEKVSLSLRKRQRKRKMERQKEQERRKKKERMNE